MGEAKKGALKIRFDRRLRLEFHGTRITSDAGLLACRELDDALGLTVRAPVQLQEIRHGRNIQHELAPLLRQSVYGGNSRRLMMSPLTRGPRGRSGGFAKSLSCSTARR